jgi:NTE family protein
MSYLLFTSSYTSALVDIGYHDAARRIDEIEDFLYARESGQTRRPAAKRPEKNRLRQLS